MRLIPLSLVAGLGIAGLALSACGDNTGPDVGAEVVAERRWITPGVVRVSNRSSAPVYTFKIGRINSAVVDWIPCVDGDGCVPIPPGGSETDTISTRAYNGERETEALVYWWKAVPAENGGFRHDSIRVIVVRL